MKKCFRTFRKACFWLGLVFGLGSLFPVLALRWIDPPASAFIYSYNLRNERPARYEWVDLEQISAWLQISVVAAEDQKFPYHFGFDVESIKSALREPRKRPRGASTISQQTAKNLFLWKDRNFVRKGIEAWFTLLIEVLWPKKRILEVYLNIAEFGPGIYGAGAASQAFFHVKPKHLNPWQSGLLAAVLPNPGRMSAAKPSDYVKARASRIYRMSKRLGGRQYLREL